MSASGFSEHEVAERAGVDEGFVAELVGLGIARPGPDGTFSSGDVRRARIIFGLRGAGLPTEAVAEAIERGDLSLGFLDLPVYDRFAQLSGITFRELGAKHAIPLDLLVVLREAMGFAQPSADDVAREDELLAVPLIEKQLQSGFDRAVIERWLRVYGECLRRIADTETSWWRTEVETPHLASGLSEAEMLELAAEAGEEMTGLLEQAMLAVYHAQQEHAWTENLVVDIENVLDRAGLWSKVAQPPAICFVDISGFTRMTEERGDEAAAILAERLSRMVQRACDPYGGKVVKWLGDGVMLHFRDPGPAVVAALRLREDIPNAYMPPAHAGIHAGPVIFQGGDYFGRTVNIAARIAERAGPGEVLVSQAVVDASGRDDVTFTAIGPVELRGVADAVVLLSATRNP